MHLSWDSSAHLHAVRYGSVHTPSSTLRCSTISAPSHPHRQIEASRACVYCSLPENKAEQGPLEPLPLERGRALLSTYGHVVGHVWP